MWHGRPGLPIRAVSIWQRSLYTSYRKDDSAGTLGDSCTTSTLFVPSQRMPSHIDFCHLPLACDDSTVVPETHCQSTSMPANARLLTLHILGLDDPDLQSFSVHSIPQVINLSSTHGFTVQTWKEHHLDQDYPGHLPIGAGNITYNTKSRVDSYDCWTIRWTVLRLTQWKCSENAW